MILALMVWIIVVSSLSVFVWYNDRQHKMAARELDKRELSLKNYAANVEKTYQAQTKEYHAQLATISSKKAEIVSDQQRNLQRLTEAQKIENAAKNKIVVLQKEINQLQADLSSARQRAKKAC
jgi:predicted RNase H-like nuclease (RuvC/YqgF family)